MSAEPQNATQPTASWKRFVWPAVIVALLGGHLVLISAALLLSTALIPAATVAPSGYAEALAWDEEQALRRESERLGWSLEVLPSRIADLLGERDVAFVLEDADGAMVDSADLRVTLYHHSRPGEAIRATIPPALDQPGVYAAKLPLKREGLWRLSASAKRGGDELLVDTDFWLPKAEGAP